MQLLYRQRQYKPFQTKESFSLIAERRDYAGMIRLLTEARLKMFPLSK